MEPIGQISGLASGIDFRQLVDAIIEAESRPALLLAQRKDALDLKTTAWGDVELRIRSAFDRSSELADPDFFKKFNTDVLGGESPLTVTASSSAVPGSVSVEVLQLASREKIGSNVVQDRSAALGFSGEFVVGGRAIQVVAGDSLDDVAQAINAASFGSSSGGVTATVVGASAGGSRLVLTAKDEGAAGIRLADGSAGVLRSLGFLDTTTGIKYQTSDGATSDGFRSATADIASLLGLTSPPAAGSVTIGALNVAIDLQNDSLTDIAAAINTAAAGAGSPISAQIVTDEDAAGNTIRRLDIGSTTSFVDTNGILETLGVLEAGRGAVAQQVRSAAFTDGDAATVATAATRLADLWVGGSAANVSDGDTLTIQGTHGDGSSFTKTVSIANGDTLQDLVDQLNSGADGFGVGTRTATASVVDGAVVVTDDTGGSSRLNLSIVSHNEGGGSLDFGEFSTVTAGRDREINAGTDAELLVDGAFYTRTSNNISDVVEGLSMNLTDVSQSGAVTVSVMHDADAVVSAIESFVQAYNAVSEFVLGQFTGIGAEDGEEKRPLSGDRVVRQVRDQMRATLQTAFSSSVSSFANLSELGIEANQQGGFDIDTSKLKEAVEADPSGVERIFSAYGTGSVSNLEYISSTGAVEGGTYDVFVTAAATRASITGAGFGGTYVDDGTADVMTITDASTGATYDVSLTNGMTLPQIVDAVNAAFDSATQREIQASDALSSDAVGTHADEGTLLQDLFNAGGTNVGVADGDTFTISGTRDDGSSFFREWTVSDVSTQNLGALRSEIAAAVGTDVVIDFANGVLTATSVENGTSPFTLSVSSDNLGGGTLNFGTFDVIEAGRGVAGITASDSGGQLQLSHEDYGSVEGFTVAFAAGGTDGSASLGVGAASYSGTDVAGTLGGHAATGQGQLLTGDDDGDAEGLVVKVSGSDTGSLGNVTVSRGIASLMETLTDGYLDGSDSSIQGIVERLDTQKRGIDDRIDELEQRLEIRAENLMRRFAALEEALARAQSESAWLQAQLGSLAAPAV